VTDSGGQKTLEAQSTLIFGRDAVERHEGTRVGNDDRIRRRSKPLKVRNPMGAAELIFRRVELGESR